MQSYDFCYAWSWPYDIDFAGLLESACQARQISLLQVTPANLEEALQALAAGQLSFQAFFDRASDTDEKFNPLADWAYRQDLIYFNRFWLAQRTWDKVTMHHLFTRNGLDAPYTVILPSYQESPELPVMDLSLLGESYAIKPAHGGGGKGVVLGALSWEEMLQVRQQHPQDQYLLQAKVVPAILDDRPAWFRMIYCLGAVYASWWDPLTHVYAPITVDEQEIFKLSTLTEITLRIASLSRLEIFSTEIAYTSSNRFLVVDYINDPIDLRPQSKIPEGVPDNILGAIAGSLVDHVAPQYPKGIPYA